MNPVAPAASAEVEFGNIEANLRFLGDTALLRPGVRVLEIGSGRGTLLHELRTRHLDVVGVDTSLDRIAEARARYGDLPITATTGVRLPYPDGAFDVVLSFDVFEHIAESDAHLAEVRRVLRTGGWYLLQTPNKWTNTVFETIRWRSVTRWRADHCALHTYGALSRRLARHRFRATFADVPVVTDFYRGKIRAHLGRPGVLALRLVNPDRLPRRWRTNFYVRAEKLDT